MTITAKECRRIIEDGGEQLAKLTENATPVTTVMDTVWTFGAIQLRVELNKSQIQSRMKKSGTLTSTELRAAADGYDAIGRWLKGEGELPTGGEVPTEEEIGSGVVVNALRELLIGAK